MNQQLQSFARQTLLDGLSKLPPGNQRMFKLMYGFWVKNPRNLTAIKVSNEECEAMSVEQVVAQMQEDKLDWAMQQVQNSLNKLSKS